MQFDPAIGLFKVCEVELKLLDPNGLESDTSLISGLFGRIVRLEAEDTFHPGTMERDVERRLNKLIKWLAGQATDVIAEN